MLDQKGLVVAALTSRIVSSEVPPLSAREFWRVTRSVGLPWLSGRDATEIAKKMSVPREHADRIASLVGRGAALALAIEQLDHSGIWTATAGGNLFPQRLIDRLGDAAPPLLHGVGDPALLTEAGVGVVGSRAIPPESFEVARSVAEVSVARGFPVISGAARGVDQHAMNAALEVGGDVVGVLADSLERTVSRPALRRAIAGGRVCMVTPYSPSAPFSAGNAMGRNKIIFGLARCVVVVRSDNGTGGTWAGATEALKRQITTVASWTGPGSGDGNPALVDQGAHSVDSLAKLESLLDDTPPLPAREAILPADQLSLF